MASSSSALKILELNDQKSGMEGLEKDRINSIIYNASKGSRYFFYQQKRQAQIDEQIQHLMCVLQNLTDEQKQKARREMDALAEQLEARRDLSRVIVHVDMDAFYAAVEIRDNPQYKDKPIAVGTSSMLSTSNYIARRFGVRAAMPGFIGKKLCPDLIVVPPDFAKYTRVSNEVREVLTQYDPNFIATSLDEAYLDITDYLKEKAESEPSTTSLPFFNESDSDLYLNSVNCVDPYISHLADEAVQEMRQKIFEKTQLTASAGIAPNMMLAKICSDKNKPDGQFKIPSNIVEIKEFIKELPARKVSGIGPVQEQLLRALGFQTCQDLFDKRELLPLLFSPTSAHFYLRASLGIGCTEVKSESSRKSKSVEVTFQELNSVEELTEMCSSLCRELANDLQAEKLLGKVVVLKMKTVTFEVRTRNHTLAYYTSREANIFQAARTLLMAEIAHAKPEKLRLRLMGIRMSNLVDEDIKASAKQATLTELFHKVDGTTNSNGTTVSSDMQISEEVPGTVIDEAYLTDTDCDSDDDSVNNPSECGILNANGDENIAYENLVYVCPVCQLSNSSWNLDTFNSHIDVCLNKETVKELVKSTLENESKFRKRKELSSPKSSSKKKCLKQQILCHKIDDYFC